MSFRNRTFAAILALLGLSALNDATAQPTVPMRPNYNTYNGLFGSGRGNYYSGNNSFGAQNVRLAFPHPRLPDCIWPWLAPPRGPGRRVSLKPAARSFDPQPSTPELRMRFPFRGR